MGVSESTKRLVAFRSGDVCARCKRQLTLDYPTGDVGSIGECAHIEGEHGGDPSSHKPPAARFNPNMTDQERNSFSNLLYLCTNCHTIIDKIPEGERNFPVEYLRELKLSHEKTVRKAMVDAFLEVGFEELAEATHWVASISPEGPTKDFSLRDVSAKMERNAISAENLVVIKTGLAVASEIREFIVATSKNDSQFPEKLRDGFLQHYFHFKNEGARGDELFESMCQLAQRGFKSQKLKSASLAVLIYLFESCELFEK